MRRNTGKRIIANILKSAEMQRNTSENVVERVFCSLQGSWERLDIKDWRRAETYDNSELTRVKRQSRKMDKDVQRHTVFRLIKVITYIWRKQFYKTLVLS